MKEYIINYLAWKFPSKCHVRILEDADKPITVICSQMFDNQGGSVTNYLEEIHAAVQQELLTGVPSTLDLMRESIPRVDSGAIIDATVATIMLDPSYPLRLVLKTVPLAWKVFSEHRGKLKRIDDLIWVEHYPKGTLRTLFDNDLYSIVLFNPTSGIPKWQHMSLSEIAKRTQYPVTLLQKDISLLGDLKEN